MGGLEHRAEVDGSLKLLSQTGSAGAAKISFFYTRRLSYFMRLSEGMPSENTLRDYSTILLGLLQIF